MQITQYKTELNLKQHYCLISEKEYEYHNDTIQNSEDACDLLNNLFRLNRQSEEYVYMISLNNANKINAVFEISHGTVNQSLLSPREIYSKALICGAVKIIIAHNHPSGSVVPSKEDVNVFKILKNAGDLMNICLIDFLILGNGYYSFLEQGEYNRFK